MGPSGAIRKVTIGGRDFSVHSDSKLNFTPAEKGPNLTGYVQGSISLTMKIKSVESGPFFFEDDKSAFYPVHVKRTFHENYAEFKIKKDFEKLIHWKGVLTEC